MEATFNWPARRGARMRGRCRAGKLPRRSNPRLDLPGMYARTSRPYARDVRVQIRRVIYAHGRPFARDTRRADDDDDENTGGKCRPSLRLAGHGTTDELWPMNVLALWTRALFERGARMHGREMEGNLEFGTIPPALPPTFGSCTSFPVPALSLCFRT